MTNSSNLPVYSFGERGNDKWYALEDGIRIKCDEDTIEKLWWQWLMLPTAKRADADGYTIFKVTQSPMSLNLKK